MNESFVKAANWINPIGETLKILGSSNETYHVIGVVKDYHFASLTKRITPQLFSMNGSYGSYYIKLKPNTAASSLKWIQKTFQQLYPMSPYSYVFKNDENQMQYADVEKWKQIILFGAILTIFISCIGLFGLSSLSAEKRTKEIGIRKVNGAKISEVLTLLNKDFVKWVAIAFVIASPIAWYAMHKWLESFAYKTDLSWWIFALAGLLAIAIALITVSWQSWKAATRNPVEALRYE